MSTANANLGGSLMRPQKEDDIDFEIGFTHRGPIMEKDLLKKVMITLNYKWFCGKR